MFLKNLGNFSYFFAAICESGPFGRVLGVSVLTIITKTVKQGGWDVL
jgi:hypothetical protein